jgi:hypothetical protein
MAPDTWEAGSARRKLSDYTLKIEHGVPAPSPKGKFAGLIAQMKVGDSILFPPEGKRSAYNAVHFANKTMHGRRYLSRRTPDGYRVWRIK